MNSDTKERLRIKVLLDLHDFNAHLAETLRQLLIEQGFSSTHTNVDVLAEGVRKVLNAHAIVAPLESGAETKPPLGLRPRKIAREERMHEILDAMLRYIKAEKLIPDEWLKEFSDLQKEAYGSQIPYSAAKV